MRCISLLLLSLFVLSCTSKIDDNCISERLDVSKNIVTLEETSGIVYPKDISDKSNFRSVSVDNNWENWKDVKLRSGVAPVPPPWAEDNVPGGSVPDYIRLDIKKENGWDLIAHTVNGATTGVGVNYLIFHNKYSGILKVFYYVEDNVTVLQNTAMWKVQISTPQNMLGFSEEFSDAQDSGKKKTVLYCSNITTAEGKGFTKGWNCFQFELAYDPNFSIGNLMLSPFSMNSSDIVLDGSFQAKTEGLIFTVPGTAPYNPVTDLTEGVKNAANTSAVDWIKGEISGNKIANTFLSNAKDAITNIATNGVKAIIGLGINKLFGSFSGAFGAEKPSYQKIQMTTNGTIGLKGKITSVSTGGYMGVTINISKTKVGLLGAWNLKESPIIYLPTAARLIRDVNTNLNKYQLPKSPSVKYDVSINPEMKDCTVSYDYFIVRKDAYKIPVDSDFGSVGAIPGGGLESPIKTPLYDDLYYKNLEVPFCVNYVKPLVGGQKPSVIFVPKARMVDGNPFQIMAGHIMRVTVNIKTTSDETFIITKSFVPRFEWNPKTFVGDQQLPY